MAAIHADLVRFELVGDEIATAVAVEIGREHERNPREHVHARRLAERAVAHAAEDAQRARRGRRSNLDNRIEPAVVVEVADAVNRTLHLRTCRRRGREVAVAVAEQDRDQIVCRPGGVAVDDQVGEAVAVEIPRPGVALHIRKADDADRRRGVDGGGHVRVRQRGHYRQRCRDGYQKQGVQMLHGRRPAPFVPSPLGAVSGRYRPGGAGRRSADFRF